MKRSICLASLLTALAASSLGQAQPATQPAAENAGPLTLRVSVRSGGLNQEQVQRAVAAELQREVQLVSGDQAALSVLEEQSGQLTLRYVTPEGKEVMRSVELPEDRQKALRLVALLSGNLARDQTSEWLGALEDQRTALLARAAVPEAQSVPDSTAVPKPSEATTTPAQAPPPKPGTPKTLPEKGRAAQATPAAARRDIEYRPLNLSLWHPVALDPKSHQTGYVFELGLAYSRIGGLSGVGVSIGALHVEGPTAGAALGTLWFMSRGGLRGVAASSLLSQIREDSQGAQFSGAIAQHAGGTLTGAQFAGLAVLSGNLTGAQVGGAFALSQKLLGAQWAGAVSVTREASLGIVGAGAVSWTRSLQGTVASGALSVSEDVDGLMLAGAVNVARDVQGIAASGALNVQRDVDGLALSVVNVQRRVRGLQIGVVNVSEKLEGGAIGLINIAGNGRTSAVGWVSQDAALAGVRFIAGHTYTELAFGRELDAKRYVTDAGLGFHRPVGSRLTLSAGGAFSETRTEWDQDQNHGDVIARGTLGLRLTPAVELFAGAGARFGVLGETENDVRPEGRLGLAIF